jgi:hypothetical protein
LGASDLILSYVVGNEINFCVQRSTILKHQDRPRYRGTFYHVPDQTKLPDVDGYDGCEYSIDHYWDPHPFQSFLAELADKGALFEAEIFGERHLWGHATDPNMSIALGRRDEFFPEIHFPADTSFLDIVFENVYSYFPPAVRFLGYRGYLEKAAQAYPNTPFVILECGYSTSPTPGSECASGPVCGQPEEASPTSFCFGGNTQLEQAEGLLERWHEVTRDPLVVAGFFVFEYYDEWWKGSERSQFVQDIDKAEEWFGIKGVHGSPKNFKVTKKLAFQTVSQMFDQEVFGPALQKFDAAEDKLKFFPPPDATHSPLQGPELRN